MKQRDSPHSLSLLALLVLTSSVTAETAETVNADIPLIDLRWVGLDRGNESAVALALRQACFSVGFFYVGGWQEVDVAGASEASFADLEEVARAFFAGASDDEKERLAMVNGGSAWRGYFPVGGELTSGMPDQKEGLYFGSEDDPSDMRPLHGANLWPRGDVGLKLQKAVVAHMAAMRRIGMYLSELLALSLGLPKSYFIEELGLEQPTELFRIFHYPELAASHVETGLWSVGEHTDYGFLTLLLQDDSGGLQVRSISGAWLDAPPIRGTLVVNIGDMLEKVSHGRFRSTPHRVRNKANRGRISFPYFFDPSWSAPVRSVPALTSVEPRTEIGTDQMQPQINNRWDGVASLMDIEVDSYGEYLMQKVGKVFPDLGDAHLKK